MSVVKRMMPLTRQRFAKRSLDLQCGSCRYDQSATKPYSCVNKVRELLVSQRTQLVNALRGHLAEPHYAVPRVRVLTALGRSDSCIGMRSHRTDYHSGRRASNVFSDASLTPSQTLISVPGTAERPLDLVHVPSGPQLAIENGWRGRPCSPAGSERASPHGSSKVQEEAACSTMRRSETVGLGCQLACKCTPIRGSVCAPIDNLCRCGTSARPSRSTRAASEPAAAAA